MSDVWDGIYEKYKKQDWINKPSIFAETAITYFPANGKILELGAGLGQDTRFFAEHGYDVVSTDLEESALKESQVRLPEELKQVVSFKKVDLSKELPFENESFDVVYSHLSLHYFDYETTFRLITEVLRVLKPGGVFAFFTNSTTDPEYGTGTKIEEDYFQVGELAKRYFSVSSVREFTKYLDVMLLDNHGETYKDIAKGIHNLIRFIGTKPPKQEFSMAIPFCGAIIERVEDGVKEMLLQTRWQSYADLLYSGTIEFPAGQLDQPFENIHDTLAREIKEECGLTLKSIQQDERTKTLDSGKEDGAIGFKPFCCVQQLKNGKPWVGFIFICEVEPGEPESQISETKDPKWMKVADARKLYETSPEKFFGLELPALKYYFDKSK
jgi:SAM-dependent methyltransferase